MKGVRQWMVIVLCFAGLGLPTQAQTNAITVEGGYSAAGAAVGVGFSFSPTTNLVVTNLQLYDAGLGNAVVAIWTSTHKCATFVFGPTGNSRGVFSTNFNFVFGAGLEYAITVQDGLANGSTLIPVQAYLQDYGAGFTVAPELAGYHGDLLETNGSLTNAGTNIFLFGVNFGYYTTNIPPSPLSIQLGGSNSVNVSWSQSSPIYFVLQSNVDLESGDWRDFEGSFGGGGGRPGLGTMTNAVISPASGSRFFRLRPAILVPPAGGGF